MFYLYTAKKNNGEIYTGEVDLANRIEVYHKVRAEGGQILSVREKKSSRLPTFLTHVFGDVGIHDKIILAKNLSSMLVSGLGMTRALEVMEKQTHKTTLKELLRGLSQDVNKGVALSEALKKRDKIFPSLFVSMVRSGEESGSLSEALGVVATQMEKSYTLTKKVRGAMIYPALVLSLMVVVSILLLIYMVPTLTGTFNGLGVELPLSTRLIIGASNFMVEHTLWFMNGVVLLILLVISFMKSRVGKIVGDTLFIRLPVIGLVVKEVNSARTTRTLSSLLSAGVPIVTALQVTEDVLGNGLYKRALAEARAAVEKGQAISSVFGKYENIYPPFVSEMVAVGEETGKISEMLLKVALYYEADVEEKTKDLSTIIEPVLMIIIGAGVGIFAISMLAPTYSLVNNI